MRVHSWILFLEYKAMAFQCENQSEGVPQSEPWPNACSELVHVFIFLLNEDFWCTSVPDVQTSTLFLQAVQIKRTRRTALPLPVLHVVFSETIGPRNLVVSIGFINYWLLVWTGWSMAAQGLSLVQVFWCGSRVLTNIFDRRNPAEPSLVARASLSPGRNCLPLP